MNEDTPINARGTWWRWPLVPIASVLAAVIGAIVVSMIQEFVISFVDDYARDGWFHICIFPLLPCALGGYLLAGVAFRVAPSAKTASGVTMTAVMGFVLIGFTAFTWTAGVPASEALQVTVASLAAIAGAVIAILQSGDES